MGFNAPILTPTLTSEQQAVIVHGEGPLLVVAGPGAGKTEVMLRRVAYLVRARGVPPASILVTTFTRKAATDLRDRLRPLLNEQAERVFVSTIHGFCQWLLETYPHAHPYGRRFQVLDERAQFLFVFSHARDLGLDLPKGRKGEFLGDVIAAFNTYSEGLVEPDRLVEVLTEAGTDSEELAVGTAYGRYLSLLREVGVIDFAGLQREAYRVLCEDDVVRADVQARFRYLVVDEHQDTNPLQDLILRIVAEPECNICVVGDDDQSIYRFRGATVENFLRFPQVYQGATRIVLSHNFRSREPIIVASSRMIDRNHPRYPKRLVAHRGGGPDVLLVQADDMDDEGERLAETILRLRENGVVGRWRDVAVLLASVRYYAEPLLRAFERRAIPYVVSGDGRFFDRPDIAHLKSLVLMLGWPSSWRPDVLAGPVLALSPETVAALEHFSGDLWELGEAALREIGVADNRDRAVLLSLIDLHRRVQAREHGSMVGLVHDLLALSGYAAARLRAGDERALANLAEFTRLAEAFDRHSGSRSIYRFGEYLLSLPERSLDEVRPTDADGVQVMTIHQAKGLEFPVVVIASVIEGRLPSRPRRRRFQLAATVASAVLPPAIAAAREEEEDVHLADQRRLMYVGLTRARDMLIVGTSQKVRRQSCRPSRFLSEMGVQPGSGPKWQEIPALPPVAAPPAEEHRRPTLSFSAVNAYLTCPLRYWLQYEARLSVPGWYFAQYGASLHRALEAIHTHVLQGQGVDEQTAVTFLERCWVPFGLRHREDEQRLRQTAAEYIARYVRHYAQTFPRIRYAELTFSHETDACVLTGRVDLVRQGTADTLELVDFKTRAAGGMALLRADLQLGLYALACESLLDRPISRLVVHLLADGCEVEYAWDPAARAVAHEALHQVTAGLQERRFPPTPGEHCRACEFRALCPYTETA